jgi:hypothetical protein
MMIPTTITAIVTYAVRRLIYLARHRNIVAPRARTRNTMKAGLPRSAERIALPLTEATGTLMITELPYVKFIAQQQRNED